MQNRNLKETPARQLADGVCGLKGTGGLFHVRRDELRHLEHRDLAFTAEYRLQLGVREDVPLVCWILEVVPLDIFPNLLGYFKAGHRAIANDSFKFRVKVKGS